MAKIIKKPTAVTVSGVLEISEEEIRALDALAGYGADAFLKVFYEKLGKAYMEPYEAGLRSLFATIRDTAPGIVRRADAAREALKDHLR